MIACESLKDIEILKILIEGGADINAVNNESKLPLTLLEARIESNPKDQELKKLYEYIEEQGGVLDWRSIPK